MATSLMSGSGADVVVAALALVGLLALGRKLIRMAGDPAPDEREPPPASQG